MDFVLYFTVHAMEGHLRCVMVNHCTVIVDHCAVMVDHCALSCVEEMQQEAPLAMPSPPEIAWRSFNFRFCVNLNNFTPFLRLLAEWSRTILLRSRTSVFRRSDASSPKRNDRTAVSFWTRWVTPSHHSFSPFPSFFPRSETLSIRNASLWKRLSPLSMNAVL